MVLKDTLVGLIGPVSLVCLVGLVGSVGLLGLVGLVKLKVILNESMDYASNIYSPNK